MRSESDMVRDLILYLTPTGQLGDQCREFFRQSEKRFGPTTAHAYPPHVTLTGFFRRSAPRCETMLTEVHPLLAEARPVPPDAATVERLHVTERWVGLEVTSPWAKKLTADVVRAHTVIGDEDALRPKDWLHLSLAYGLGADQRIDDYLALASDMIDPQAPVTWNVSLWERDACGAWTDLGR